MRNNTVVKMANIAILGALGFVLMLLGQVLRYPPAPFLELEPSDTVILVAYAMYGFPGALFVAVVKTLLNLIVFGPTGAIAVGQITALLTSLTYCFGLFLTSKVFHLFKRGLVGRIGSYAIITVIVAAVLTIGNFLFLTPTFIRAKPSTFVDVWNMDFESIINIKGSYPAVILALYIPFNLLKGVIVCALYEIIFNRVIFHLLKTDKRFKQYFTGSLITIRKKNFIYKLNLLPDNTTIVGAIEQPYEEIIHEYCQTNDIKRSDIVIGKEHKLKLDDDERQKLNLSDKTKVYSIDISIRHE